MRILLDTHILLWWLRDDRRLTRAIEQLISNAENDVYVSAVNAWEIAIKKSIGRLKIDVSNLQEVIIDSGLEILPITLRHTLGVSKLPNYHNDPFDRLLVAQSIEEPLRLLTHDAQLGNYGDHVIVL